MKLRRREDSWWTAGRKRAVLLGAIPDPRQDEEKNWSKDYLAQLNDPGFEEAKPGDVWEVRKSPAEVGLQTIQREGHEGWTVIGYVLWCPNERCEMGVHQWTHARGCKADYGEPCKNGGPSCWGWTGSIEDSDLTGNPSLWSPADIGGCGWHGFLRSGEMQSV